MGRYDRTRLLAVALASAAALASGAALLPASSPADIPAAAQADPTPCPKYTVREHMGMVAVYSGDRMIRLTDYPVWTLPEADRASLASEVDVYDDAQLASLLEDYQS